MSEDPRPTGGSDGDGAVAPFADEVESLAAEVEHLRRRLSRSEVVEAELARQHLEAERLQRSHQQATSQVVAYEALLGRKNQAIENLRSRVRTERAERRSAERARDRAEGRRREIERSMSYRLGRRLVGVLARLAGRRAPAPTRGPKVDRERPGAVEPVLEAPDPTDGEPLSPPEVDPVEAAGVVAVRDRAWARVVLVDARGLDREHLAATVATLSEFDPEVRPVVVLDEPNFDLVRAADLVFEYVPRTSDVEERLGDAVASRLVDTRWRELMADHQPVECYAVASEGSEVRLELKWATDWSSP